MQMKLAAPKFIVLLLSWFKTLTLALWLIP